ncbi:MAG TPA: two-component sensor histidine kinase, partial [Rhizobiales bacterium]|nr:two-component sensor histidine kinase [Hyphomicrobiales bacterium]
GRSREADGGRNGPLDGVGFRELAAAVPDPMILFDAHGVIAHVNPAAAVAFGQLAPGVALHLRFRAPEMHALIEGVIADAASARSIDYVERVPLERVFRVTATAVGRENDLYALVFKDQSEARRIDRMRADFIANASHELRTPLASIAGFVETLRGPAKNDPAAREHFLKIMQDQTGRMARLIDDLLSLSRLEMKPYARTGTPLDVRAIVDAVVDSLGPLAAESGVTVERRMPPDPAWVSGDRDELFQVFENLLENAIKYGQSGGRVEVVVPATDVAEGVQVSFRDYGPGIAEEHIPRITERFYRVDVESSRSRKGTGLGLAIVKHILTRHGGRLDIRSRVGSGSTFVAHFPPPAGES